MEVTEPKPTAIVIDDNALSEDNRCLVGCYRSEALSPEMELGRRFGQYALDNLRIDELAQ
jgi:hypothetical protein